MMCPIPEMHFATMGETRCRLKVFRKTAEWTMGDLLAIAGKPAIFVNVTLCDQEIDFRDTKRWENIGGFVTVVDELGLHELTTEEFDAVSDDIRVITKISDTA